MFLQHLTLHKNSKVMLSFFQWVALKIAGFGGSEVALKRISYVDRASRCSKWRPFACTHAAASSMMPWGIWRVSKCQRASSMSRFDFCRAMLCMRRLCRHVVFVRLLQRLCRPYGLHNLWCTRLSRSWILFITSNRIFIFHRRVAKQF